VSCKLLFLLGTNVFLFRVIVDVLTQNSQFWNLLDVVQRVVRISSIRLPEFASVSHNNSVSRRASSFASCSKLLLSRSADRIRESGGLRASLSLFSISVPRSHYTYYASRSLPILRFLPIPAPPERQTMSGVVWGRAWQRANAA